MSIEGFKGKEVAHLSVRDTSDGHVIFYVDATPQYRARTQAWWEMLPSTIPPLITSQEDATRYFEPAVQLWTAKEDEFVHDLSTLVEQRGNVSENLLDRFKKTRRRGLQVASGFLLFDKHLAIPKNIRKLLKAAGKVKDVPDESSHLRAVKALSIASSGKIRQEIEAFSPATPEQYRDKSRQLLAMVRQHLMSNTMNAEEHHDEVRKVLRYLLNGFKNARYVNPDPVLHAVTEYLVEMNILVGSFQGRLGDEKVAGTINERETIVAYSDELRENMIRFIELLQQ